MAAAALVAMTAVALPAEAITPEDAEMGARCLLRFIRDFKPEAKR